jgi:hypothetical protein
VSRRIHNAYSNNPVGIIWFLCLSGSFAVFSSIKDLEQDLEIGDTPLERLRHDNFDTDGGDSGCKVLNFRMLSVLELCSSFLCLSVISTLDDSRFRTDDVSGTLSIFGKSGKRPKEHEIGVE